MNTTAVLVAALAMQRACDHNFQRERLWSPIATLKPLQAQSHQSNALSECVVEHGIGITTKKELYTGHHTLMTRIDILKGETNICAIWGLTGCLDRRSLLRTMKQRTRPSTCSSRAPSLSEMFYVRQFGIEMETSLRAYTPVQTYCERATTVKHYHFETLRLQRRHGRPMNTPSHQCRTAP